MFQNLIKKDPSKYPSRMGKNWDEDEVHKLLQSIQNKKPISDIATEHQRTRGAISSALRKIAADYWFNDKKSIEEIIEITNLSKYDIENAIKRRTTTKNVTEEKKEVIILLKDIQSKLSILIEKLQ
jgi:hypothetical protein